MNAESYMTHMLNNSSTKEAHLFSRAERFPKKNRMVPDFIYHIPSTRSQRSSSFGLAQKLPHPPKKVIPPPGSYTSTSQFQRKQLTNVTSIAKGRDEVTFGSFLLETLRRKKNLPSPDKYNPVYKKAVIGCGIANRIETDPYMKQKKSIPGPGAYNLKGVDLSAKSGHYILSNFRSTSSPRMQDSCSFSKKRVFTQPDQSQSTEFNKEDFGRYTNSRYRNSVARSFNKAKRRGLEDETKLKFPAAKYRIFSEFGGFK